MIFIGIDFGTGNSVLSYWQNNKSNIYLLDNDCAYISSDILVSDMGDIEPDPKKLKQPPVGYSRISAIKRRILMADRERPEDLNLLLAFAAHRIRYLFDTFCDEFNHPEIIGVLTAPAHASQSFRGYLLEIGKKVGLGELTVIDEPTAAAIFHGLSEIPIAEERLLVIDWGCGTFDVSLIERQPGISDLNVVVVRGDNQLGGMDMDHSLRDLLAKRYQFDPKKCPLWQVEDLKIRLSTDQFVEGNLSLSTGQTVSAGVSRREFETCIQPLIERAQGLINEAMEEAHWKGVDYTIATGGPILMPVVRRALAEVLDEDEDDTDFFKWDDPLTSVAQGAAKLAYLKQVGGLLVTNKVAQSIGIRVVKGDNQDVFFKLIQRGDIRPISQRSVDLATSQDLQDIIAIEIREGDNLSAEANTLLGKLNVVVRPEEKGKVQARLNMSLSESGALETWVEPLSDLGSVRQVQPLGIRFQKEREEIQTRETRLSDPVKEFQDEVSDREVDPDSVRQIYERLKIKYHPDRKPEEREHWTARLIALDKALDEYLREIERRMRSSTLPELPWNQPDELQKIVVDEVLAQRLTHCLAQGIGGDAKKEQLVALLKQYPDYRRVLASYLFAVKRNPVLQELLSEDDRPHVGLVVLLQNLPDKPIRERHEVLKAAYRLPEERVREMLKDKELKISQIYEQVPNEALEQVGPLKSRSQSESREEILEGLNFEYRDGSTYVSGEKTYDAKERLKQLGCRWDSKNRVWYTTGKIISPKDY